MALASTRGEVKDRARAEWRGLRNVTLLSFSADLAGLNGAAIRHDVGLAATMGYWAPVVFAA